MMLFVSSLILTIPEIGTLRSRAAILGKHQITNFAQHVRPPLSPPSTQLHGRVVTRKFGRILLQDSADADGRRVDEPPPCPHRQPDSMVGSFLGNSGGFFPRIQLMLMAAE